MDAPLFSILPPSPIEEGIREGQAVLGGLATLAASGAQSARGVAIRFKATALGTTTPIDPKRLSLSVGRRIGYGMAASALVSLGRLAWLSLAAREREDPFVGERLRRDIGLTALQILTGCGLSLLPSGTVWGASLASGFFELIRQTWVFGDTTKNALENSAYAAGTCLLFGGFMTMARTSLERATIPTASNLPRSPRDTVWDRPSVSEVSFARHENGRDVTERLIKLVLERLPHGVQTNSQGWPIVLEVGAQNGRLSNLISQRAGMPVLSTDLLPARTVVNAPHRLSDLRHLAEIRSQSMHLVISSYAAEYARPDSWRSISRVLMPGGHVVALVHHNRSVIAMPSPTFQGLLRGVARVLGGIPGIPDSWARKADLFYQLEVALEKAAYRSQDELIRELTGAGFNSINIQDFIGHPFMGSKKRRVNIGWIVTAVRGNGKGRVKKV